MIEYFKNKKYVILLCRAFPLPHVSRPLRR